MSKTEQDETGSGDHEVDQRENPQTRLTSGLDESHPKTGSTSGEHTARGEAKAGSTSSKKKARSTGITKNKGVIVPKKRKAPSEPKEEEEYDEYDDEDEEPTERFDRFADNRERKKKRAKRGFSPMSSDSDTDIDSSSSSSNGYEAYRPKSGKEKRRWKLPKKLASYAEEHFTTYESAEVLKLLRDFPNH